MTEGDPLRDEPNLRVVPFKDNKIFLKRTDPYGFIELSLERGQLPEDLRNQSFTSFSFALRAVEKYLKEHERRAAVTAENKAKEEARPKIKYKPGYGPGGEKL